GRAVFSLRIEREGPIPPPPFVVAANHYSHLDPAVVGAVLGTPVRFLALRDLLGESRFLDWVLIGSGAIPTPRRGVPLAAVRTALTALESAQVVGVFPESTRVSHWGTVAPRRGAAWLARRAGVPLVPVALIGTGRAFDLDNRIHRAPITVVVGRALDTGGADSWALTGRWEGWVTSRIERHPGSEADGPPRAFHET
ncbi:MAG: lysophospholipid acyltransferase family protein, partial [Actinomycetota bacterium]